MDSGAGPGNGADTARINAKLIWQGLAVGLLAILSATAVMLFLRFAFQAFMPIELIAQWVPTVTPVSAQADGIATFGEALKPLGFTLLLGGQLLLGTLWGLGARSGASAAGSRHGRTRHGSSLPVCRPSFGSCCGCSCRPSRIAGWSSSRASSV